MARSEPGRNWTFAEADLCFPHRFLRGTQFRIGSACMHLNPEALRNVRETRPDLLLIAGGWANPTTWIAGRSRAAKRKIFWSESHLGSIRRNGIAAGIARHVCLSNFTEFAVPGVAAEEYIRRYASPKQIYRLPNIVNPDRFRTAFAARRRLQNPGAKRTLLIPARLVPEKGLVPFLSALRQLKQGARASLTIWIAGSGPLLNALQQTAAGESLDLHLLGYQTEMQMAELYAKADGFCLPSISDPNPISVVEGLWAGLSVLLSSRVGNYLECLREGKNGFGFDPLQANCIVSAVTRWLALSAAELDQFGKNSLQLAQQEFAPDKVICSFLDALIPESMQSAASGKYAMVASSGD